jgi:hypothetical protein
LDVDVLLGKSLVSALGGHDGFCVAVSRGWEVNKDRFWLMSRCLLG